MEPVTHFLTGGCLGRAGFNRYSKWATATMVLAAEAPDLDVFYSWFAGPEKLFSHRGYTHTLVGAPFVAAVVVAFMYGLYRWRRRKKPDMEVPRWGVLYGLALIAALSHILLDYTNNYGVVPFMPFSYKWISGDIVFIYEPLIWVFLIAGLLLPALFGLINQEVGYRKPKFRGRGGAIAALVLMVSLWGLRDYEHRRALDALNAATYRGQDPISISAFPYPTNPFKWYGVAETPDFFDVMNIDSTSERLNPDRLERIYYKPPETPVTIAAKSSPMGQRYLWWAKYPYTETEDEYGPDNRIVGYKVHFFDMRFRYPGRTQPPLGAWVELDPQYRVTAMGFREKNPQAGRLRAP